MKMVTQRQIPIDLPAIDRLITDLPRGGIVPVIHHQGEILYGFGINSTYRRLIDLAGHRETWDPTIGDTAIREFNEETLMVFPEIELDQLIGVPVVTSNESVLFFVPLDDIDPHTIHTDFHQRLRNETKPEVLDIRWLTLEDIENLTGNDIYYKPYRLLQNPETMQSINSWFQHHFSFSSSGKERC